MRNVAIIDVRRRKEEIPAERDQSKSEQSHRQKYPGPVKRMPHGHQDQNQRNKRQQQVDHVGNESRHGENKFGDSYLLDQIRISYDRLRPITQRLREEGPGNQSAQNENSVMRLAYHRHDRSEH